jgi:taurine dioxygenase
MRITPFSAQLGAEVEDIDVSRPLPASDVTRLRDAVAQYCVLRFRGQRLSDAQLLDFSARFGDLDISPGYVASDETVGADGERAAKYVAVISNVVENGKPIGGLGDGEAVWHADMTYIAKPPALCALHALEIPSAGGDTYFLSMQHAFETLPEKLRERVQTLQLKHDATYNSAGEVRRGVAVTDDPRHSPGWVHPLVVRHPRSGEKTLFLGRRRNASIVGLPLDESEALLDQLWEHATQSAHWRQHWQVGDLLMWDNVASLHKRDSFPSDSRRVMHRAQVLGTSLSQ